MKICHLFPAPLLAALLIGCAPLAPQPTIKYDQASEENARNFSVAKNIGRVYYSAGKVTGGMYEVELKGLSRFYVNSTPIAVVGPSETLVFDLRPGDYAFAFSTNAEPPTKNLDVRVLGGDTIAVRGDIKMGTTGFGAIGAAANPGGPELLRVERSVLRQPINPVAPQSCPSSICVTPLAGASSNVVTPQILKGADRLNDLNDLRKKGLISNADYEAKKAAILKEM